MPELLAEHMESPLDFSPAALRIADEFEEEPALQNETCLIQYFEVPRGVV